MAVMFVASNEMYDVLRSLVLHTSCETRRKLLFLFMLKFITFYEMKAIFACNICDKDLVTQCI